MQNIYKSHISKFLKNNYSTIYYQIIDRALVENRKKTKPDSSDHIYYELHHILPRSIYPEFVNLKAHKWNGVLLTAREHFICHKLLVRMASTDVRKAKMLQAVMYLITSNNDKITITSREYEWYRTRSAIAHSVLITGKYTKEKASSYGKKWYSNLTTGQSMQYLPSEMPDGWTIGRAAFKKENNSVTGTKWYHDPATGDNGMFKDGKAPVSWIKGRGGIKSKGKASYYNLTTGETKRFLPGQEPNGWLSGNLSIRGRIISNHTKQKIRFKSLNQKVRSKGLPKPVMCEGVYYNSLAEANKAYGANLTYRLYSDTFPNFYFLDS